MKKIEESTFKVTVIGVILATVVGIAALLATTVFGTLTIADMLSKLKDTQSSKQATAGAQENLKIPAADKTPQKSNSPTNSQPQNITISNNNNNQNYTSGATAPPGQAQSKPSNNPQTSSATEQPLQKESVVSEGLNTARSHARLVGQLNPPSPDAHDVYYLRNYQCYLIDRDRMSQLAESAPVWSLMHAIQARSIASEMFQEVTNMTDHYNARYVSENPENLENIKQKLNSQITQLDLVIKNSRGY